MPALLVHAGIDPTTIETEPEIYVKVKETYGLSNTLSLWSRWDDGNGEYVKACIAAGIPEID